MKWNRIKRIASHLTFNTPIISISIAILTLFIAYMVAINSWVSEFFISDAKLTVKENGQVVIIAELGNNVNYYNQFKKVYWYSQSETSRKSCVYAVRENLLLANLNATPKQLEDACKQADIYNLITEFPDKFETVIGEKGIKLSGGQKQRLVIAQVLLKNPQVVIFDEATSSLDYQSEQVINKAIMELTKDKTIIVIAHRLSPIIRAKKVIVLDEGKIVDIGTHDELTGRCGEYITLFKGQYNLKEHMLIS